MMMTMAMAVTPRFVTVRLGVEMVIRQDSSQRKSFMWDSPFVWTYLQQLSL